MNSEACLTELELMESAYSDQFEVIDVTNDKGVAFLVRLEQFSASLRYHIPADYPDIPLKVTLEGTMRNNDRANVSREIQEAIKENSVICSMEICHIASAALTDIVSRDSSSEQLSNGADMDELGEVRIARFLIYFHHIMSMKKRQAICEGAEVLSLGGFSKHGYPGVCVIEGHVDDVLEFVRQIQQLRWKHMTVRGEEIETCVLSAEMEARSPCCTGAERRDLISQIINSNRRLPLEFVELENMSVASSICKQCDLHDLFMTVMKNYGGGSGNSMTDK